MKHVVYFAVCLLFAGCWEGNNVSDQFLADSARYADSTFYADSFSRANAEMEHDEDSIAAAPDTLIADSSFAMRLKFSYTRAYCGGARPNDEILLQYSTPQLLTNSTLSLVNHHTGETYSCKTGADGIAFVKMKEGKYDVFLTKDINSALPTGFDAKCTLWTKQLLYTVKVVNDGKMRDVVIHFVCNPCDNTMKQRQ